MKTMLIATIVALLATPAWAGGTSVKGTLVPFSQPCDTGNACQTGHCTEGGASCATNSDCNICGVGSLLPCATNADCFRGTLSPKSKLQLSGNGQLKITLKGVTDSAGTPVTTDGVVGTADDYIVLVQLYGGAIATPTVKVDFKNGKGKVTADLSSMITGPTPVIVGLAFVYTAPSVPANCPGTNSPTDITARIGDNDCGTGLWIGVMGVLPGQ